MAGLQMPWLAGLENDKRVTLEAAYAHNYMENQCQIPTNAGLTSYALTGIICTIGPASGNIETLIHLIDNGMRIARLNFSHGSHEEHANTVAIIREAVSEYSRRVGRVYPLAIALDTKGPEIRTGGNKGGGDIQLITNETIKLTTDVAQKDNCDASCIYVDYVNIVNCVQVGDKVLIDDGLVSCRVNEIGPDFLQCTIENGGSLGAHKGCNLPGCPVDLPALSEKDKGDLGFGVEQDVDMIFASFIRRGQDVIDIRSELGEKGKAILIVTKIENQQGVDNIDDILEQADGVMVARGDLGCEVPLEKVIAVQKQVVAKCNKKGKPMVCATQMLESMHKNPRPTRAEITDVANAVIDGADCTMLSGETAKGQYPVEAVKTMFAVVRQGESMRYHKRLFEELSSKVIPPIDPAHAVAIAAVLTSLKCGASAIVVITTSGRSAKLISQYRPRCPILAVTRFSQVARQLQLWGSVDPVQYISPPLPDWQKDVDARIQFGITVGKKQGYIKAGDAIIIVSGWRQGAGFTNTLRVLYASQQDTT